MNQIKIGNFISEERKKKGFTQVELADRLGISNKTISKWERGNGFPEVSLLLPLCGELGISVNELITGERIAEEEYRKKAEENMVEIIKKSKVSKQEKIISLLLTLSIVAVTIAGSILGAYFKAPEAQAAIGIMTIVSWSCFVAVWIATTISLRKNKKQGVTAL